MDCNPNALAQAAACFCFNERLARAVKIYLLCRWAQEVAPPVVPFSWTPASAVIQWRDLAGNHTGDLAAFNATADLASIAWINMDNAGVTSVSGVNFPLLPTPNQLGFFTAEVNPNLTTIDFSHILGFPFVFGGWSLDLQQCPLVTAVDLSNCTIIASVFQVTHSGVVTIIFDPAGVEIDGTISCDFCANLTSVQNADKILNPNVGAGSNVLWDFRNGALDEPSVNGILAGMKYSYVTEGIGPMGPNGDELHLEGGGNHAPTGQGLLDVTYLTAHGCAVTTN